MLPGTDRRVKLGKLTYECGIKFQHQSRHIY